MLGPAGTGGKAVGTQHCLRLEHKGQGESIYRSLPRAILEPGAMLGHAGTGGEAAGTQHCLQLEHKRR